jgi:hypothetical protein
MKGWLPRDEELSDFWHTALTFAVVAFFAANFIYLGCVGLLTRTFDPRDFWYGSFHYRPRQAVILHGAKAIFAGLAEFVGASVFVFLGVSNLRFITRKNLVFGLAIGLVFVYHIATEALTTTLPP